MADVLELLNVGAQAWDAVRDADEIEILNRNNGVPTLGSAHTRRDCVLFWHAALDDDVSLWVYLKLGRGDKRLLRKNKVGHLLDGVTLRLQKSRAAALGIAYRGDLIALASWEIPAGASAESLGRYIVEKAVRILEPKARAVRKPGPVSGSQSDVVMKPLATSQPDAIRKPEAVSQPPTERQQNVIQALHQVHQAQAEVAV